VAQYDVGGLSVDEMCVRQKKKITSARAGDQKTIDQALLANIKKEQLLASYLATSFSLRKGDKPHEMKF
jgi:large subunit ribosomal protein L6e